jgi:hypothetical protein
MTPDDSSNANEKEKNAARTMKAVSHETAFIATDWDRALTTSSKSVP